MPVMISSTIKPRSRMHHLVAGARLDRLDIFRARRPQTAAARLGRCGRATSHPRAQSAPVASGFPPGDEPFDLAFDHEGKNIFPAQERSPRRMMTVKATIEQMSSGHMKRPPRTRKSDASDCKGLVGLSEE